MMTLDFLSVTGIVTVTVVVVLLYVLCKLSGCNKPIC